MKNIRMFRFKLYFNVQRLWYNPSNFYTRIRVQSCSKMATQTNLLGYFGKTIARKRKSQSDITSFFKKADRNQKNDDDVVYVGGMCLFVFTFL